MDTRIYTHAHINIHKSQGCFGSDLDPRYAELIDAYRVQFEELQEYTRKNLDVGELSVTWKVHILICHLVQWLRKHGEGLARYSEQTCEASHHDFAKTHQRYKRKESHPDHGKKLRRSVVEYSSRRI